ncbi:MAG: YebC/PmpR family DNA-binding transcriptional regulator [Clostridia bacterium]|nr:YebC/PmpR family DNA-binding transcriptional regulator [Clostridia bacterium]
MSGHSKWHNIQARKGKSDAQRGKIFTKIGREIAVSVKEGGADMATNNRLRLAVQKAKENNMPNDNITKAIKKASGEINSVNYESITYEGYGNGGSAVIVECLTDNKNRTAGDVRHLFDKFGGSLGANGCVSYLFKRKGTIMIEKTAQTDSDTIFMLALEAGAEDIEEDEESFAIYTTPEKFNEVVNSLETSELLLASKQIDLVPDLYVELDEKKQELFQKMIDNLEDLDDVQEIYHNVSNV